MYCFKCPSTQHNFEDCPQRRCANKCPKMLGDHWGTSCPYPCTLCQETGHYLKTCPQNKGFQRSPVGTPSPNKVPSQSAYSPAQSPVKMLHATCYNCYGTGHFAGQCKEKCRICGDEGHTSYVCPIRTGSATPAAVQSPVKTCFNCHGTGHFAGQCRESCRICNDVGHTSYVCPIRTGRPLPPATTSTPQELPTDKTYNTQGTQTEKICISSKTYRRMKMKRLFSESNDEDERPSRKSRSSPVPAPALDLEWQEHAQLDPCRSMEPHDILDIDSQ